MTATLLEILVMPKPSNLQRLHTDQPRFTQAHEPGTVHQQEQASAIVYDRSKLQVQP